MMTETAAESRMVVAVSSTVVDAGVVSFDLNGNLYGLDHLEGYFLGDMYGYLDGLNVFEGFGHWNVLHDGDLNGDLDGVGLGNKLQLGGDGRVGDFAVGFCVNQLGLTVDRLSTDVMAAMSTMSAMAVA